MAEIDTRLLPRSRAQKDKKVRFPRPFRCFYYKAAKDTEDDWAKVSACASELGAATAGFKRLFTGEYYQCTVHDIDGVVRYRLVRINDTITVSGVFFDFDTWIRMLTRRAKALEKRRNSK